MNHQKVNWIWLITCIHTIYSGISCPALEVGIRAIFQRPQAWPMPGSMANSRSWITGCKWIPSASVKNSHAAGNASNEHAEDQQGWRQRGEQSRENEKRAWYTWVFFNWTRNLSIYQTDFNIVLGVKPYKCPICDAQFNRPANLKTHLRIHSGEKPYKCDTCSARFVQVAHLRAHMLIHTGEKPYPCQICGTR